MGGTHQLGGLAEEGAGADRGHLADPLAPAHHRAGIGGGFGACFDRHRFAGQHRLVQQQVAGEDAQIGRHDAAERELHDVAGHQVGGRGVDPGIVAAHPHARHQALLEQFEGGVATDFLHHGEADVKQQQRADHRRFQPLTDRQLQNDGGFQHPRHRRPEMPEDAKDRVGVRFDHRVGAEFGAAAGCLGGSEASGNGAHQVWRKSSRP